MAPKRTKATSSGRSLRSQPSQMSQTTSSSQSQQTRYRTRTSQHQSSDEENKQSEHEPSAPERKRKGRLLAKGSEANTGVPKNDTQPNTKRKAQATEKQEEEEEPLSMPPPRRRGRQAQPVSHNHDPFASSGKKSQDQIDQVHEPEDADTQQNAELSYEELPEAGSSITTIGTLDDREDLELLDGLAYKVFGHLLWLEHIPENEEEQDAEITTAEKYWEILDLMLINRFTNDGYLTRPIFAPDIASNSHLDSVIARVNLAIFCYMLMVGNKFLKASEGFFRHVLPKNAERHDGVLKMMVELKTQVIAHALQTQNLRDIEDVLEDHFPSTPVNPLAINHQNDENGAGNNHPTTYKGAEAEMTFIELCNIRRQEIEKLEDAENRISQIFAWEDSLRDWRNFLRELATTLGRPRIYELTSSVNRRRSVRLGERQQRRGESRGGVEDDRAVFDDEDEDEIISKILEKNDAKDQDYQLEDEEEEEEEEEEKEEEEEEELEDAEYAVLDSQNTNPSVPPRVPINQDVTWENMRQVSKVDQLDDLLANIEPLPLDSERVGQVPPRQAAGGLKPRTPLTALTAESSPTLTPKHNISTEALRSKAPQPSRRRIPFVALPPSDPDEDILQNIDEDEFSDYEREQRKLGLRKKQSPKKSVGGHTPESKRYVEGLREAAVNFTGVIKDPLPSILQQLNAEAATMTGRLQEDEPRERNDGEPGSSRNASRYAFSVLGCTFWLVSVMASSVDFLNQYMQTALSSTYLHPEVLRVNVYGINTPTPIINKPRSLLDPHPSAKQVGFSTPDTVFGDERVVRWGSDLEEHAKGVKRRRETVAEPTRKRMKRSANDEDADPDYVEEHQGDTEDEEEAPLLRRPAQKGKATGENPSNAGILSMFGVVIYNTLNRIATCPNVQFPATLESPTTKRRNHIANVEPLPEQYKDNRVTNDANGNENRRSRRLPFSVPDIPRIRASSRTSDSSTHSPRKEPRKRRPWTLEQIKALEDGMREYGATSWASILRDHDGSLGSVDAVLRGRTQVDLKDKARNEKLKRLRMGLDLGVWLRAPGELRDDADSN
ncbi:hypothetical protein BC938DRAFT_474305 [Jimgerdemannia flammicorona]|uniref:Myb-like domain-containing protein n=1 Tax=Jimgerdemannia flammicorona TaxID=994334 RepID=A0A433QSN1_9FUNG|nr:hypothetical protein BC938DRAFT_474305 [Jimgerdemannia flammicorona]